MKLATITVHIAATPSEVRDLLTAHAITGVVARICGHDRTCTTIEVNNPEGNR